MLFRSERERGTLPCAAPGEVASEGETGRKRPQKKEHGTRTYTHAHPSAPLPGPGTRRGRLRPWLRMVSILPSGRPPFRPLPLAGCRHCQTAPRKPNLQVAGQPESYQLPKANLPLKVTAKSWRKKPFSPGFLGPEDFRMSFFFLPGHSVLHVGS